MKKKIKIIPIDANKTFSASKTIHSPFFSILKPSSNAKTIKAQTVNFRKDNDSRKTSRIDQSSFGMKSTPDSMIKSTSKSSTIELLKQRKIQTPYHSMNSSKSKRKSGTQMKLKLAKIQQQQKITTTIHSNSREFYIPTQQQQQSSQMVTKLGISRTLMPIHINSNNNLNNMNNINYYKQLDMNNSNYNLNEIQRLYVNWNLDPGYRRNLEDWEVRCGLHDWAIWRTKLNENLILTSVFNTPLILNQNNQSFVSQSNEKENNKTIMLKSKSVFLSEENTLYKFGPNFQIEPGIARFIYYYGFTKQRPLVDPESYMFYGIPRIKLNASNMKNNSKDEKELINTHLIVTNDITRNNEDKIHKSIINLNKENETNFANKEISKIQIGSSNHDFVKKQKIEDTEQKEEVKAVVDIKVAPVEKHQELSPMEQKPSIKLSPHPPRQLKIQTIDDNSNNKSPQVIVRNGSIINSRSNSTNNSLKNQPITTIPPSPSINRHLNRNNIFSNCPSSIKAELRALRTNSEPAPIITGINVKEKVKAFESKTTPSKEVNPANKTNKNNINNSANSNNNKNNTTNNKQSWSILNQPRNGTNLLHKANSFNHSDKKIISKVNDNFTPSRNDNDFLMENIESKNYATTFISHQVMQTTTHHQSRSGLAAAILSTSLTNSSQFISPPLPGHLVAEHKRDRSNDADLKRDINVNSLILNTSNILDGDATLIATTEFHKHEPDNELVMMMMPNEISGDTTNTRSNLTVLGGSIDDLNLNNDNNLNNINSLNKMTNSKNNRKLVDVLKAADGDIIFGNNNNLNNTQQVTSSKTKPRSVSASKKKINKASTLVGSIASAFVSSSNRKLSNSADSKTIHNTRKSNQNNDLTLMSEQNQSFSETINTTTNLFTNDLKTVANINNKTHNNSLSQSSSAITTITKSIKTSKKANKKTERHNYFSPFKNMLKSKDKLKNFKIKSESKDNTQSLDNEISSHKTNKTEMDEKTLISQSQADTKSNQISSGLEKYKSKTKTKESNKTNDSKSKHKSPHRSKEKSSKTKISNYHSNHTGLTVRKVKKKSKSIHKLDLMSDENSSSNKTKSKTLKISSPSISNNHHKSYQKSKTSKTVKDAHKYRSKTRHKPNNDKNGVTLISSKFSPENDENFTNNPNSKETFFNQNFNLKFSTFSFSNFDNMMSLNINDKDLIDLSSSSSISLNKKKSKKNKKFNTALVLNNHTNNNKNINESSSDSEAEIIKLKYSKTVQRSKQRKKSKQNGYNLTSKNEFKNFECKKEDTNNSKNFVQLINTNTQTTTKTPPPPPPPPPHNQQTILSKETSSKTMPILKSKSKSKNKTSKSKNVKNSNSTLEKCESNQNEINSSKTMNLKIQPPSQPPPPPPLNLVNNNNHLYQKRILVGDKSENSINDKNTLRSNNEKNNNINDKINNNDNIETTKTLPSTKLIKNEKLPPELRYTKNPESKTSKQHKLKTLQIKKSIENRPIEKTELSNSVLSIIDNKAPIYKREANNLINYVEKTEMTSNNNISKKEPNDESISNRNFDSKELKFDEGLNKEVESFNTERISSINNLEDKEMNFNKKVICSLHLTKDENNQISSFGYELNGQEILSKKNKEDDDNDEIEFKNKLLSNRTTYVSTAATYITKNANINLTNNETQLSDITFQAKKMTTECETIISSANKTNSHKQSLDTSITSRNKPKTSKEILQEIARLTNGTTPSYLLNTSKNNNEMENSFRSTNSRNAPTNTRTLGSSQNRI